MLTIHEYHNKNGVEINAQVVEVDFLLDQTKNMNFYY